ncbi:hypothetical protein [Paraburkholderia sp. MM5482-R1]|uniref:hypothetical protein n=1 Tax=unclassified Paraburkholderia TaxID=2615204 RepID=UPI003D1D61FA
MKVRELIAWLAGADPDSVVVFLDSYADSDESGEIRKVFIPSEPWTHETGYSLGIRHEGRYPGHPRADNDCHDVTETREHLAVMSNGPTNLIYDGVV